MRDLLPFLKLYKNNWFGLTLGIILSFVTLACAIGLLTLSGWFISASAVAGLLAISNFNFMLPAAGVRGFSIARTAGRWSERVVSHDATFKVLAQLRLFFFKKLTPLVPGNALPLRDADILNRLVADVDAMDHLYLRLLSPLVVALLGILGVSAFLSVFIAPIIGLTLGMILLTLMLVFPVFFYQISKPYGAQITHEKSHLRIALLDWLQGQSELQIFGAAKRYREKACEAENKLLHAQEKMANITGLSSALLLAANGLTLLVMLWLASESIVKGTPNPMIAMVAFTTIASFELIMPIAGAFQYLSQTLSSAKRLNEIIQAEPETAFNPDGFDPDLDKAETADSASRGDIEIKNVSYAYQGMGQNAVEGVTVRLKAGEKVALLGRTGCGKSTLLQLLTRTWDPQLGEICLDGVPLNQWRESALRSSMTVVSQRVDIFNDTLRNNLKIARPTATDEALIESLNNVNLTHLLEGTGLDSWLGEGGRQLSGGEKRRLGIARALLHDAPVLLLDEPTEGLDVKTEQEILSLLFDHTKDKTVLFITHRLVGLNKMDNICLMDEGRIIEQGTHEQLNAAGGQYAHLLQRIQ